MNRLLTRLLTVVMTSMISMSVNPYQIADAGCDCENGSSMMPAMSAGSPYMHGAPMGGMPMAGVPMTGAPMYPGGMQGVPMRTLPKVPPPPGTLGYTYLRPSRLVPKDKHPRDAMVEITCVPEGAIVTVDGMKGYITESGTWMFETERPLLPHRTHIYRVEIKMAVDQKKPDVRVIRLIPGRVVDLKYEPLDRTI